MANICFPRFFVVPYIRLKPDFRMEEPSQPENGNNIVDQQFLEKLSKITEENLSDETFGAVDLARKMGLSHSGLHRKLKLLINQSISRYIRENAIVHVSLSCKHSIWGEREKALVNIRYFKRFEGCHIWTFERLISSLMLDKRRDMPVILALQA